MRESPGSILTSSVFIRWVPFLLCCFILAHRFWMVYAYSLNLPFQDDIFDFLQFINRVDSAGNVGEAFKAWFAQHNDHRTAATRLLVYAAYIVQGEVDFRTLAILSNVGLVLILLLFYVAVRGEDNRWLYLLGAALLILSPRAYRLVAWGQPGFAYHYAYFYTFACLFALHKVTPSRFALAAVLGALASFTLALGNLVWLLGLASLLHQSLVTKSRSWVYPAAWLLVAAALVLAWSAGFTPTRLDISPEYVDRARAFSPGILLDPTAFQLLKRDAAVVLVILGCAVTDTGMLVAGAFGASMLAVLIYVTFRYFKHEDARLTLCAWFAVAAAPALALRRGVLGTPEFLLAQNNRYCFFSVMLLCLLCLLLQLRLRVVKTPVAYVAVLLSAIFYAWACREAEPQLEDMKQLRYSLHNRGVVPVYAHGQQEIRSILGESVAAGRLRLPCRPYPECESSSRTSE